MDIYYLSQRLKIWFAKKTNFGVRSNFKESMTFFDKLPLAKNDIDRSFYQYRCRCFLECGIIYRLFRYLINFISFFMLIYVLYIKKNKINAKVSYDAFFNEDESQKKLIPESLFMNYTNIIYSDSVYKQVYCEFEKKFILSLWKKHPLNFTFVLKNALKIGYYNYIITSYSVGAIIVTNEYSYTSSILTNYCEAKGVRHINIMHGEATKSLARCYFRYTKCYVWDEHYANIFIKMRAEKSQFIIERPLSFRLKELSTNNRVSYKYFLSNESAAEMLTIKLVMQKIGLDYKVRLHPIWTNVNDALNVFNEKIIEYPQAIDINQSIATSKAVIARKSTVLFQAYCNNIDVIIDDLCKPNEYSELIEEEYIMLNKPHTLLSDLVESAIYE